MGKKLCFMVYFKTSLVHLEDFYTNNLIVSMTAIYILPAIEQRLFEKIHPGSLNDADQEYIYLLGLETPPSVQTSDSKHNTLLNAIKNKRVRCSRIPRLSDTRYSANKKRHPSFILIATPHIAKPRWRYGRLWTLEWTCHPAKTNLRCAGSPRICMPSPNTLALLVSEVSAFIRTDGHG